MSTPAAKRRRIEASQTLSKPFRSPFKTPLKTPADATTAAAAPKTSNALQSSPKLPLPSKLAPKATPIRTPRAKKSTTSPISTAALHADPDIAPLLRAQRELERQLKELKEELDTAEQARKIEQESKKKDPDGEIDAELTELVQKWTGASRLAAEEMFGTVRDRVNKMGGPRAWKEMQKKQMENNSWDEEPVNNNKDDDDDDNDDEEKMHVEKRDIYAEYSIDPETENEKSQRTGGAGDTGEMPGQEDDFTIAMMLRTLNVDLVVIGYDKEQQRWIE